MISSWLHQRGEVVLRDLGSPSLLPEECYTAWASDSFEIGEHASEPVVAPDECCKSSDAEVSRCLVGCRKEEEVMS